MVGPEVRCEIEESDELGLDIKGVLLERNGAAFGVDAGVSPKTLDRVQRR